MKPVNQKGSHRAVNPIETEKAQDRHSAPSKLNTVKKQIVDGAPNQFIDQLLGVRSYKSELNYRSGEMFPGEIISFSTKRKDTRHTTRSNQYESYTSERKVEKLGGIDYRSEILHGSENITRREAVELDKRIQDVLSELKRLIGSSSILKAEFAVISVEDRPLNTGKYYTTFLEWLLIEIKKIRVKVEDAGAWLKVMKSKKAQKKYGAMAKKHGTSFTLNNERTPATQTG